MKRVKWSRLGAYVQALFLISLALYFCFYPLLRSAIDLRDPGLYQAEIPQVAYRWHRNLTERIEPWARERVDSAQAATLGVENISGTEWPIFSAVYFLWATEALQADWEADPARKAPAPAAYAAEALEAAAALVADPQHATWVKLHWGEDYLEQENIFYRMLLIGGLGSYERLTGRTTYAELYAEQVESLATELDQSPYGLLDDYPGQCYPIDILPAVALIQRSQIMAPAEEAAFVQRAYRGFSGPRLDPASGLPAYRAAARQGIGLGPARGVGAAYMLIWAPELWPEVADDWYQRYEQHFWMEGGWISGVRELGKAQPGPDWFVDVDAGPVVAGYGTAASAFGIGAARANGRFDHAYPLSAQALALSWPLPDGTLLIPRLVSNLSDAPYVGEAALLFNLTRLPQTTTAEMVTPPPIPKIVYLVLSLYGSAGFGLLWLAVRALRWAKQTI